jgi:hypothetical protein
MIAYRFYWTDGEAGNRCFANEEEATSFILSQVNNWPNIRGWEKVGVFERNEAGHLIQVAE